MAPSGKTAIQDRIGDKGKALEAALLQIERQFGEGYDVDRDARLWSAVPRPLVRTDAAGHRLQGRRSAAPRPKIPSASTHWRPWDRLDRLAQERFGKPVIALAARWMLDQGITSALWGARRADQLQPVDQVRGGGSTAPPRPRSTNPTHKRLPIRSARNSSHRPAPPRPEPRADAAAQGLTENTHAEAAHDGRLGACRAGHDGGVPRPRWSKRWKR